MERVIKYDILQIIKERWSARSIDSGKIPKEDIFAVIEAGSYAPSCFNEQPWRYLVSQSEEELATMQSFLNDRNRLWAGKAPVLMLILSRRNFERNQAQNKWSQFDTGTSWGFMQIEAWKRGYVTHAMAGFDSEKAREVLNIPEEYDLICMVAMGKLGKVEDLDSTFRAIEKPNTRKSIEELMFNVKTFL